MNFAKISVIIFQIMAIVFVTIMFFASPINTLSQPLEGRDIELQPYSKYSIWNMPIGDGAVYLDAEIDVDTDVDGKLSRVDEDIVLLDDDYPLVDLRRHSENIPPGFSFWGNADGSPYDKYIQRCDAKGEIIAQVHVPENFVYVGSGNTPNANAGVRMANSFNVIENQPFARCQAGGEAYTQWPSRSSWLNDDWVLDMRGDGVGAGGHGGSRLASSAGNIMPYHIDQNLPIDTIKTSLKFSFHETLLAQTGDTVKNSYIWPAQTGDCCSDYLGDIPEFTMGALLALRPDFDINSLQTEFGKRVAWTLQNYGAYIVDTMGGQKGSVLHLGNDGTTLDVQEDFRNEWGYDYAGFDGDNVWLADYKLMLNELNIITNNTPSSIGGGGNPLQCLADDFKDGISDLVTQNPNGNVIEPTGCKLDNIVLNIRLLLEGALINQNRTYRNTMRNQVSQYNTNINNNFVDIIELQIINEENNISINSQFLIDENGNSFDINDLNEGVKIDQIDLSLPYKINLNHRNHIGIGLRDGITFTTGFNTIDTTQNDISLNQNMKMINNYIFTLPLGDIDQNKGIVNAGDRNTSLGAQSRVFVYDDKDINMDGIINSADRNISIDTESKIQFLN